MCEKEETVRTMLLNTICRNILVLNSIIPNRVSGKICSKSVHYYISNGWKSLATISIANVMYCLIYIEVGGYYDVKWATYDPVSNYTSNVVVKEDDTRYTEIDWDFPGSF